MPNQRSADKERFTIAEYIDKMELLRTIAIYRRVALADVIREATDNYLTQHTELLDQAIASLKRRPEERYRRPPPTGKKT